MFATSASSSAMAARKVGSWAAATDSSAVIQRNTSHSSPTSEASAITRFFGEWYGSQFLTRAKRRIASFKSETGVVSSAMRPSVSPRESGPRQAPRAAGYNRAGDRVNAEGGQNRPVRRLFFAAKMLENPVKSAQVRRRDRRGERPRRRVRAGTAGGFARLPLKRSGRTPGEP